MEGGNNWIGWVIAFIVLAIVFSTFRTDKYQGQTAEQWYTQYQDEVDLNQKYKNALEEANTNIEDANDKINDAKSSSGGTYFDMRDALDSLEEIDTVSEPSE